MGMVKSASVAYKQLASLLTRKRDPPCILCCWSLLLLQTDLYILRLYLDHISSDFCMLFLKAMELCTQWYFHEIDYSVCTCGTTGSQPIYPTIVSTVIPSQLTMLSAAPLVASRPSETMSWGISQQRSWLRSPMTVKAMTRNNEFHKVKWLECEFKFRV